jgi:hypothetical protein
LKAHKPWGLLMMQEVLHTILVHQIRLDNFSGTIAVIPELTREQAVPHQCIRIKKSLSTLA